MLLHRDVRFAILEDNRFEIDRFHIGRTIRFSTLSYSYPNDIIRYSSDGGELIAHAKSVTVIQNSLRVATYYSGSY